jgi:glycosyltransferase involved in cell wall biosynthesis
MRVVHVIETPGPGGAEKVLVDVATGLPSSYESFGLMLCESWTGRELTTRGVPVSVMPLQKAFDTSWPVRFAKYLREHRIGLVHSHEFTGNCYAAAGARLAGVPIVCTTHGKNYWPYRFYRRQAYRWVCNNAHAFVAVSTDLAQFAAATLGVKSNRVRIVRNGIDTRAFEPDTILREQTRDRLMLQPSELLILSVGELTEVKGHEYLLRAFARMKGQSSNLTLAIAGDGPLRAHLESLASESGIAARVKFLGHRRDIKALLNAADVFVMPSLSEGLPLAILEAMAIGLPIIATAVGGVPEVIKSGETGWLVQPQQPEALASTLCNVLQNESERRRIGNSAQVLCRRDYALDATIRDYVRLYEGQSEMTRGPATSVG